MQHDATKIFDLLHRAAGARNTGLHQTACAMEAEAANLLNRGPVARWLRRYFRWHMPHAAEDLVQDVQLSLLAGRYEVVSNALAMLRRVVNSRLVDHVRALGRCPVADVDLDDDEITKLVHVHGATDPHLRLLMHRGLQRMAAERPKKAELLELAALGYTYREIAAHLLQRAESDITTLEIHQVRDRIHHARMAARRYLDAVL